MADLYAEHNDRVCRFLRRRCINQKSNIVEATEKPRFEPHTAHTESFNTPNAKCMYNKKQLRIKNTSTKAAPRITVKLLVKATVCLIEQ